MIRKQWWKIAACAFVLSVSPLRAEEMIMQAAEGGALFMSTPNGQRFSQLTLGTTATNAGAWTYRDNEITATIGDSLVFVDPGSGTAFGTPPNVTATVKVAPGGIWSPWHQPGSKMHVTTNYTDNTISFIDEESRRLIKTISVCKGPQWSYFTPSGGMYVSCFLDNAVGLVDTTTMTYLRSVPVGRSPQPLHAGAEYLIVGNTADDTITLINRNDTQQTYTIPAGKNPRRIMRKPYVLNNYDYYVLNYADDTTTIGLFRLNRATPQSSSVIKTIDIGGKARHAEFSADLRKMFVAVENTAKVAVIDLETDTVTAQIPVGGNGAIPYNIRRSNDGYVYVTVRGENKIVVIDETTLQVTKTLSLSRPPLGASAWSSAPRGGWWYSSAVPGRGYAVKIDSRKAFVGAFLYRADGSPVWFVASGPLSRTSSAGNTLFEASLDEFTGNGTLTQPLTSATPIGSVGRLTLEFDTARTGTLTIRSGSTVETSPIERFSFVTDGAELGTGPEYIGTDWHWTPGQGGVGYFIESQQRSLFMVSFMYDANGRAVWYYNTGLMLSASRFEGDLLMASGGTPLFGSYRPAGTNTVGAMTMVNSAPMIIDLSLPGRMVTINNFRF